LRLLLVRKIAHVQRKSGMLKSDVPNEEKNVEVWVSEIENSVKASLGLAFREKWECGS
jgi:hypothetical protein